MGAPQETGAGRMGEAVYYLLAVAVGGITGLIGTVLHLGVDRALEWPARLRALLPDSLPLLVLATAAVAMVMVLVPVWIVRRFAPEAAGSGVQEIEGAMEGLRVVRWRRVLPVKFVGGLIALGSGLVIGREGPTIHMGASVAQVASERLGLSTRDGRGLLAAGAAAGLAAAFNAPLAAILFVIEETRRQFPFGLRTYTAVILASVVSGIVTEAFTGRRPFLLVDVPAVPLGALPAFVGLGIVLGLLGVVFNRCLVWSMDTALAFGRRASFYLVPALVGAAVGVLLILRPEATQGGETLAATLAEARYSLGILTGIVAMRFAMTMASYSTGVPGGIFAPILALATASGLLYGTALVAVLPLPESVLPALAVAAMGGLFSATVRAPLVGVVLVAELTGAYGLLVPVILTCVFANLVADWLGGRPIYEVLLERTLRLAGEPAPARAEGEAQQVGGWDQRERRSDA